MPYPTIKSLPKQIQGLPTHAKEIWKSAFNASFEKWGDERARKIAWGAVKQKYKKEEGKWVARKLSEFMEELPVINLPREHAKMIWEGTKSLIIHDKNYRFMVKKKLYLVDKEYAWGIVTLTGAPKEISLETFKKLKERHRIDDKTRIRKWGPRRKLYTYNFEFEKFDVPKKVEPHEEIVFLNSVEFTSEKLIKELKENVKCYNPNKLNNKILAEDWNTISKWQRLKDGGKNIPFSDKTIFELSEMIYEEVIRRLKEDGAHKCFTSIYHLALKKAKSRVITLSEFEFFEPMRAFTPLKAKSNFFDLEELVGFLYKERKIGEKNDN